MQQKTCRQCNSQFTVTDEDLAFYEKFGVPSPKLCPVDRSRMRLAWRNARSLYKRKCDLSGEIIFSHFAANVPFPVYQTKEWYSDKWNPLDFGREYNFSRPFFEQFAELYNVVPQLARAEFGNENCDFSNGVANCKNCYWCFTVDYCEDCFYVSDSKYAKKCVDCLGMVKSELCYECLRCDGCYDLQFGKQCTNCRESIFLTDCRSCSNCIACANLQNKQYHIFNHPVSPEEFSQKKKELETESGRLKMMLEYYKWLNKQPKRYYFGHSNEDFSGDDVRHIKNCQNCFSSDNLENCRYCNYVFSAKDCMDYDIFGDSSERIYNCVTTGLNCTDNIGTMYTWSGSSRCWYCCLAIDCQDSIGCIGIRNKQYCILNKQYSKDEFEQLREQIKQHMIQTGEWGEFYPTEMLPFAFNESMGYEYYPLTREEIEKRGWRWKEPEDNIPLVDKIIKGKDLPENIDKVGLDILQSAISCAKTARPYMIQQGELKFYLQQKIPVPRLHPEVRHNARLKLRNPYLLSERRCDCSETGHNHTSRCPDQFQTTYAPNRPEKVYCEECYQKSVI